MRKRFLVPGEECFTENIEKRNKINARTSRKGWRSRKRKQRTLAEGASRGDTQGID